MSHVVDFVHPQTGQVIKVTVPDGPAAVTPSPSPAPAPSPKADESVIEKVEDDVKEILKKAEEDVEEVVEKVTHKKSKK